MEHSPKKRKRRLLIVIILAALSMLYLVISTFFQDEEKELRTQVRQSVKRNFPDQVSQFSQTIGLFHYRGDAATGPTEAEQPSIVLIHGLDDPGKVWQNLAPTLASEGYDVWQMHYPNDQPIEESTLLFRSELEKLKQNKIQEIVVIAHSMGGLVTRDLLTNPDLHYQEMVMSGAHPEIVGFVMVGTPNHGSQLARFRFFAEFRDHLERLRKGEANWLGSILDGAGEAKIDLLPNSSFLTRLNSRPHPAELDTIIIAGITTPWSEEDIRQQLATLGGKISDDYQQEVDRLTASLISMTHGLGDGLVTVDSTRLDGIPHVSVNGTHLTMIRNLSEASERIPPAIPVIMEWLSKVP